jgi:hypothetical protein
MSFGLCNAAQTFQRFMDEVLRGLDFCFAYLDDILVFSRSLEEHEQHIRSLFNRLQTYGIIINPTKCVFWASEVTFLGYKVPALRVPVVTSTSPHASASKANISARGGGVMWELPT